MLQTSYIRYCSHCGKSLSDPASLEAGIGPQCRNKNSSLYAKTIQSNLPIASALVLGTLETELPKEIWERWSGFKNKFIKLMEKSKLVSHLTFTGADFRGCVKDLDYFLSYPLNNAIKKRLIDVVKNLGYVGLASVMAGEASLSKAKVWFENGKVFLQGKSCKPGFLAMRKISGITTPKYRGHNVPYSAPASEVDKFLEAVQLHWPLYENNLEEIKRVANEWLSSNSSTDLEDERNLSSNTATIVTNKDCTISVKFPWVKNAPMYDVINKIKQIPKNSRKYDPITKTWICDNLYKIEIINALKLVFNEQEIIHKQ